MHPRHRTRRARSEQRISGPTELLQAVPYLLGFHPRHSLVLVGLHDGRLVVTARLDLRDAHEADVLAHTLSALVRGGASTAIAAVYGELEPEARSGFAELVRLVAADAGCDLVEVLLVTDGRWWSLLCAEPGCCPPEGRELPAAPSAFATAAAYDGVVAFPDRTALAEQLEPLPAEVREALDPLLCAEEQARARAVTDDRGERYERALKRAMFAAARASDEPEWRAPDDDTVARFGAALMISGVRDPVWLAVDGWRIDGRPLWRELARRLPGPYAAWPLFLFGWASWRAGNGALAGMAAQRAVAADPKCSAADLLLAALSYGVDPRQMPKLRLPRSA